MEQSGQVQTPRRTLGPIDATCVVIGAIIGVGIFFTPSNVVKLTGSGSAALLAWALAGAIAMLGAFVFAHLGRRYHASGAQYEVLRDAYGPMTGFSFVLCNATAIQGGAIGAIALTCAVNLRIAFSSVAPSEAPSERWTQLAIASALIVCVTLANIIGVKWGAKIQNLTVYAKVLTLLLITGLAAFAAPSSEALQGTQTITPGLAAEGSTVAMGIVAALVPAFFSYGGWQHALWISGEVRDPERNLPRAVLGGVTLVIVVYLLANWAYLRLLGASGVAASPALAADAVATVWPETGRRIIAGAVGFSAFGVLNAQLLSGPRLVYGMARDGRFFESFGRVHPKFATPVWAILLLGTVGLALMLLSANKGIADGLAKLLTGAVFIDGVFFALTGGAIFLLRKSGRLSVPAWMLIVAALFVVGEVGVVIGACWNGEARLAPIIGTGWIVVSVALYFAFFASGRATSTPPT